MTWRKWPRRASALLILLVGIVIAAGAGVLFPYFLAKWISNLQILVLSAVMAATALGCATAWATACVWPLRERKRFTVATSAVLMVAFSLALYILVLRPHSPITNPAPLKNTRFWQLSTGSRIAYSEYDPPSGVTVKPEPILFLHGGPGFAISPFEHSFFNQFAADGYRVYLFDQAGSGLSGLLPVREYSVRRFVDDIEAIRQQLGTEKLILIGHSWGSTLAANYIANYPTHVAKVVFYSPGEIWNWGKYDFDFTRTAHAPFRPEFPPLRLLAAFYLMENKDNPELAEKLLPQREAQELYVSWVAPQAYLQVCNGDTQKLPPFMISLHSNSSINPGFNPYVTDLLDIEIMEKKERDPHSRLRGNLTPAIVLYSECDFLAWTAPLDYRTTFANAKVYYIPRAGHIISLSQPELMARIIRAFLLGEPDPVPPYSGEADPRTLRP